MIIEKADSPGFCFGVKRAINLLEKTAREQGGIETLGAVVHNTQVLQGLADSGIRTVKDIDDIKGDTVATSSHGVSPQLNRQIRERNIDIINTTCPFVNRAQVSARRLTESGFFVIVYGDVNHPEIKGILGWANNNGIAALDLDFLDTFKRIPRRFGILSQTTQIPAHFTEFVKKVIDRTFTRDSEIRIIDTICHDIRERQAASLELANRVDLMLVIGGRSSANVNLLTELCSTVTEAHLVETTEDIDTSWLEGKEHIGVTGGASTPEETVDKVIAKLESMA